MPAVPALMFAVIVIVTVPPTGIAPFHRAVLPEGMATPLVALTPVRVSPVGRVSVNSSPGLSAWLAGPQLISRRVLVMGVSSSIGPLNPSQKAWTPFATTWVSSRAWLSEGSSQALAGGVIVALLWSTPEHMGWTIPLRR